MTPPTWEGAANRQGSPDILFFFAFLPPSNLVSGPRKDRDYHVGSYLGFKGLISKNSFSDINHSSSRLISSLS